MFACLVSAVEVEDLYSAKILVKSQQSADRTIALKRALTEVFIKIGGNESVIERPLLKSAIRDVSKYVLQYRYQFDDQELSLVATFNESKVNQLFIEADLPIWGKLRPQIVFWVVNETDLNRSLLTSSTESELKDAILLQAKRYGLPALFPIGDITDVEQVSASDVWGRFISPISRASKRYLAEAIVLIRISDHSLLSEQELITKQTCKLCSKMLVADWGVIDTQKNQLIKSNSYQHTNVSQLISDVVANLSEQLHLRYAYNINENNQYLIDIANVNSLDRYAKITEFFRELSVIKSFKLISALGENRRFKLEILGSKQSLLQSLQLNQSLKQNIDPLAPQVEDEVPVFYWSKP